MGLKEQDYMQRAIELALKGWGRTSPNPMVGAVIVKNGKIIAEGWHNRFGGDHAEIVALKRAGRAAKGAKLYVTVEPCSHFGKTPPCVDAIIHSQVKDVVVGMKDPNPLTNGKSIAKMKRAGVKIKVGVLKRELEELNAPFIKAMKTKMPFVVTKTAQTLDGKIATATGDSQWITSWSARQFARRLRNGFDAILVGVETVLADDPGLNAGRRSKVIKKVILDSSLRVPKRARLFDQTQPSNIIIATTKKALKKRIQEFQRRGVQVIVCPAKNGKVSLKWIFKRLGQQGIQNILMEGGANVIGSAFKEKLVDRMHIYIAPKILGDQDALSSIDGLKLTGIHKAIRLKDLRVQSVGPDLFLEGDVHY